MKFIELHVHIHHDWSASPSGESIKQQLTELKEIIMANQNQVTLALEQLDTVTTQLADEVQSVVVADQAEDDAFRAQIQTLKDQIAAGEAVTQQQLDDVASQVTSRADTLTQVADALKQMGTDPSNPVPVPEA